MGKNLSKWRVLEIKKVLFEILIDVLLFNRPLTTRRHNLKWKEYLNFITKRMIMLCGVFNL
jgi:hypothetical protein